MTLILFIILFILLMSGIPIFIALVLSSTLALILFTPLPLEMVPQRMFAGLDQFSLMAIPFFILAANVMQQGGISSRIIRFASSLVGHFRGGLAMTVVVACMFLGTISGSSPATVVAIGALMLPALSKVGYDDKFSVGLISSSSAVAVILPPSIGLIVYASVTGTSVGDLFMAGIGPGLLYGLVFIGFCYFYARKYGIKPEERSSKSNLWKSFKASVWALGIPVLIVGGIYGGIFTPTESAAIAAVYAIIIAIVIYRDLDLKGLLKAAIESGIGTAQIMILLAAASIFSWLLTRFQIPQMLAEILLTISESPIIILLLMNIIMLIMGMFIDPASFTMILAPLFLPIALAFNIDPVHLGIIMIVNGAIGMFTPPFGLNLFVASGVSKIHLNQVMRGVIPFIGLSLIILFVVMYFEQISLWLPNLLN